MSICQTVQDWLPWYVSGQLTPAKMGRLAHHIDSCNACQKDLAQVIRLRHALVSIVDASPTPVDRVWEALAPALKEPEGARIDVGSFLVGMNFGIAANNRRTAVQGNLNVLGHEVRIIGKRKKGA